jgi:cytochrome c oxidase subunit 1
VTTSERQARPVQVGTPPGYRKGPLLANWLSTTDHKVIGHLYLITSFGFFLIGGIMAMIIRAQLMDPDNHIVSDQVYNEPFTMHGTIMRCCSPPRCSSGSPTRSCRCRPAPPTWRSPGLNLLSYYFFVLGGLILVRNSHLSRSCPWAP